ncbi:MAG: hypothetical protein RL272_129, partial [Candidatus Parcubacteria bacterium]
QTDARRTLGIAALFRMMVRVGVEGLQLIEPATSAAIEERLMDAARGRLNVARYLNRAVRLADFPIFKEERPFVRRLLG